MKKTSIAVRTTFGDGSARRSCSTAASREVLPDLIEDYLKKKESKEGKRNGSR